ncbi:MAG: hypothetical protein RIA62_07225 [Cyclobacteriaceae bacterium]
MENILDKTTQLWVRLTGRKIDPSEFQWLVGPNGDPDLIGEQFIARLTNQEGLTRTTNEPHTGLMERIHDLGFTEEELKKLNPEVIDFYERTADYEIEFWSSWCGIFRPFGWLLSVLFSKRLQQLNLPLNPMDASKGLTSQIVKLKKGSSTKWTIWYRTLKSNNRVIYSGVYTHCSPPNYQTPLLKVVFPLPNGNATVLMTKKVMQDGSLLLSSDGRTFGQHGFYFTLTNHKGSYWARYVSSMHEWIRVYFDADDTLRADHNLDFYGMRFLNLHYKMRKKDGHV